MRKSVTQGGESAKDGSGRRPWVRARPPQSQTPVEDAPKRRSKARFLEPYRLTDERRAALLDCLRIAGVGDTESRDLFAAAVEYDIAGFRQSCPASASASEAASEPLSGDEPPPATAGRAGAGPGPTEVRSDAAAPGTAAVRRSALVQLAPTPADPGTGAPTAALLPVAAAARSLAALIGALERSDRAELAAALQAADPFQRGYAGAYLDALRLELERIGAIPSQAPATAPAEAPARPPPELQPDPQLDPTLADPTFAGRTLADPALGDAPLGDAARRFVRRVARVYEQCLESRPAVAPGSPFLAVLRILAPEAGVRLPTEPQALALVFSDR
jgi:hypothetical protein